MEFIADWLNVVLVVVILFLLVCGFVRRAN
jgi:hypothetical protein